jgi:6,7-dimethyl-8-ribityllumazine synthase
MNILIIEARYHPDVADALVDGASAALENCGDAARACRALATFGKRLGILR